MMTLPPRSPSASRKIGSLSLRAVAIAWGALCLLLALQWFVELGMSGFPDGYISPYARATSMPLHVLAWACMAQGVYFLIKGVVSRSMRAGNLWLQLAAAAALTVAPVLIVHNCPHSQTCSDAYQALTNTMMDDGTGG
jgi:hypothetical protein